MNYSKFLKQNGLLTKLLVKLGVLHHQELIIRINNFPDADLSSSDWREDADNFFKNYWNFKTYFSYVSDFRFGLKRLYHFSDIEEAQSELGISLNIDDIEGSLNKISAIDEDYFGDNGSDTNFNESFKLHKLRLTHIDNIKKRIWYEGGFFGNHETYENIEWGIFAEVELTGTPIIQSHFYKELIGESYLLLNSGNFKLSYFIAYSALENFINTSLGPKVKGQLGQKLVKLFESKVQDVDHHEIYTEMAKELDLHTDNRNIVGHAKGNLSISETQAESFLLFVLILIGSIELNLPTFSKLNKAL